MSFSKNRLPPSALVALAIALLPIASLGALKLRLGQYISAPIADSTPSPDAHAADVTPPNKLAAVSARETAKCPLLLHEE